jgi:hypothetical protein
VLSETHRDDAVVFLDAGCELNVTPAAAGRLQGYLGLASQNDVCLMRTDHPLRRWCKNDLVLAMDLQGIADDLTTIEPGVMVLKRSEWVFALLDAWIDWGRRDEYHYIDDSPSVSENPPQFVEHRHDQAILTGLLASRPEVGLPQESYFPGTWRSHGVGYPFWAARNRLPISIEGRGPLAATARTVRTVRDRLRDRAPQ